ncbi:MAG: hypothetical protein EP338_02325 [Bacteroidetes bacterium]|nr:MAG: hypothetical protein EP338_02325 [Bacteroidota bacterium]
MICGCFSPNQEFRKAQSLELAKRIEQPGRENHSIEFHHLTVHLIGETNLQQHFFIDEERNCLLVYSGHIYGEEFVDSEKTVARQLYERYLQKGNLFCTDLNGDFSLLIYAPKSGKLLLARDHLGIVPLSYAKQENTLLFSSDHFHLCALLHQDSKDFNPMALMGGITSIPYPLSIHHGVHKLLPGHFLNYDDHTYGQERYWFPESIRSDHRIQRTQALEELKQLLNDAIRIRIPKSGKCTAHVSGGLDSSYLAAHLSKFQPQIDRQFYSWSPDYSIIPKQEHDERELIEAFETHTEQKVTLLDSDPQDSSLLESAYFPGLSSFEEERTLAAAKEAGYQILFSGWGGDEFLGMTDPPIIQDVFRSFRWLRAWKGIKKEGIRRKVGYFWYQLLLPSLGFIHPSIKETLRKEVYYLKKGEDMIDWEQQKKIYCYRSRRHRMIQQLSAYRIAERTDISYALSYLYNIEYKYPLLDKRIIEYLFQIPSNLVFSERENRSLMRQLSRELLPPKISENQRKRDPALDQLSEIFYSECTWRFSKRIPEIQNESILSIFKLPSIQEDLSKFGKEEIGEEEKEILMSFVYNLEMFVQFCEKYDHEKICSK